MSWNSYLDNLLEQTKDSGGITQMDRGALIGINGSGPWTTSDHPNALQFQGTESADIAKHFESKDLSAFQASGIVLEGVKYMCIKFDDGDKLVLGKMKGHGDVIMQASKMAIVIAHCPEERQRRKVITGVMDIVSYLESNYF